MIYIFDEAYFQSPNYTFNVVRQAKEGDLIFYSKEYFEKVLPGQNRSDIWYDAIEALKGNAHNRTNKISEWFNAHNFSSLNPNNWTEEEKTLFRLTWG